MGDRCYMTVTCRREDAHLFTCYDLGFSIMDEDWNTGSIVQLEDIEANYAHCGDMPTSIPYYGSHTAGDTYGEGVFACDGGPMIDECEATCDFPVVLMGMDGTLDPQSHLRARYYLAAYHKAKAILEKEKVPA